LPEFRCEAEPTIAQDTVWLARTERAVAQKGFA
jgi:hypothetical protein